MIVAQSGIQVDIESVEIEGIYDDGNRDRGDENFDN